MQRNKLELIWVGKDDPIEVEPRILIENKELSNVEKDEKTENILIHGDNLLALKALEQKFSNKVSFIYIDPPYNTGKAFEHYDDNIEHSIWLNLMSKRLQVMKHLLKENGVICCQIDDSEAHYLKIMMDEIFGRNNYLTSFYIQVRYPDKTLAEDSDYQKIIEQILIYTNNRYLVNLNRPAVDYSIEKFVWKITEKTEGETIHIGNKKVVIFKKDEYEIEKIDPCLTGLKETWATGSLSRVKASAGEFFELYLSERKSIDGLNCLYKVYGIGEDGLSYRYITGPKKPTANKGKFYSGIPLDRIEDLKNGKSLKYLPVSNFYDFAAAFGNCRLEGGVGFKGGKKPEILIKTLLDYYTQSGDLVLDSFLGSGTTCAVAQKMGRKWIGVEMGEHAYSLDKPRLDRVISGKDNTGITKLVNWQGGGGYRFYELAPTLIKEDAFGQTIINPEYNAEMLAAAVAKHEGYFYNPDETVFWKQSNNQGKSYLFVTTIHIDSSMIETIKTDLNDDEFVLIACKSFDANCNSYKNISIKKIPQSLLKNCEFGVDNYILNIVNPPEYQEDDDE